MEDEDSLERTLREENTETSLPVLTIGSVRRLIDSDYRERCALRLLEVVLDLEAHMGRGRIYLP